MQTRTKWLAISTATLLALSTPALAGSDTSADMQDDVKSTQQSEGDAVLQGEGGQPKGDDIEPTGVVEQGETTLPPASKATE